MRSLVLVLALLVAAPLAFAQQITVTQTDMKIGDVPRRGLQTIIELDKKFVEKLWERHLKEQAGKLSSTKGVYTVEVASIPSITKTPIRLHSKVETQKEGTLVWYSLDLGSAYVTKDGDPEVYAAADKFLHDFAKHAYKQDIALQAAEAEKVLAKTQSDQEATVKAADGIKAKMDKNVEARKALEKQMEQNSLEKAQIEKEIEVNLKAQETAKKQTEDMKKALEVVKAKADKID